MTVKQLSKLENRIATLKKANRIVWIEGIDREIIKGKVLGKPVYFVRAESLNENGGNWYYIVRWEAVLWRCSCEATKPCKHEKAVKAHTIAQYQAKFEKRMAAQVGISTKQVAEIKKIAEQAKADQEAARLQHQAELDAAKVRPNYLSREAYHDEFSPCTIPGLY